MLNATVVGRVKKVSEVKEVIVEDKAKETVTITVVFQDYLKNTHYVSLEFWGTGCKKIKATYKLGDLLCANGTVKCKPYLDKDGNPKAELVLISPTLRKIRNEEADDGSEEKVAPIVPVNENLDF